MGFNSGFKGLKAVKERKDAAVSSMSNMEVKYCNRKPTDCANIYGGTAKMY